MKIRKDEILSALVVVGRDGESGAWIIQREGIILYASEREDLGLL